MVGRGQLALGGVSWLSDPPIGFLGPVLVHERARAPAESWTWNQRPVTSASSCWPTQDRGPTQIPGGVGGGPTSSWEELQGHIAEDLDVEKATGMGPLVQSDLPTLEVHVLLKGAQDRQRGTEGQGWV